MIYIRRLNTHLYSIIRNPEPANLETKILFVSHFVNPIHIQFNSYLQLIINRAEVNQFPLFISETNHHEIIYWVQDCDISVGLAMQILQSYTNPMKYTGISFALVVGYSLL